MLSANFFCPARSVSGNPQHKLRLISVLVLFFTTLSLTPLTESFAAISPENNIAQSEPEKSSCSMRNFFSDVKQFFGIRYRFGGQTPEGFDCSGFVRFMYDRVFSMRLPRTSREMATIGKKVERSELRPGDLIFFQTKGSRINHVGIFVGNDTFVHSSLSKGITEDKLQQKYYDRRFAGAVRVLDNPNSDFLSLPSQSETARQLNEPS
jgi:hypothetical protein